MITLSVQDVLFAAGFSLALTWLIIGITKVFRAIVSLPAEFNYKSKDLNRILQKCYNLFPRDSIQFKGELYKRGMVVRITTIQNKNFEGQIIGLNNDNMICLMTNKYIVAHELDKINEMNIMQKKEQS